MRLFLFISYLVSQFQLRLQRESRNGKRTLNHSQFDKVPDPERLLTHRGRTLKKRRWTEERLRHSEARLEATFEQAAVGIAMLAPDGRWLRVNRKLCEIVGYSQEELLQRTFQSITHPDDMHADLDYMHRLLAREIDTYSLEKRYLCRDGGIAWIHLTVALTRKSNGEPDYFISVIQDIQARKQTELALKESETLLKEAQRLARIGSWRWDFRADQPIWSEETYRIFALDSAGPPANFKDVQRYFTPESWTRLSAAVKRCINEGEPYTVDAEVVRRDGSRRWIVARGEPVYDANGVVRELRGMMQDITERKQIENVLRESQEKLELFIQHAPVALAMFDRQMRYVAVSRRWLHDYGLEGRYLLGLSHYEVFPEVPNRWKRIHQRALAGEVLRSEQDRFERTDGSVHWLRWEVRPWYDNAGDVRGIVVFSEDITARKFAEQRLREAALHDPLTGLPNRALIFEYGSHLLAAAKRRRCGAALLFVDLDRFKPINDRYGHETGDRLLQKIAKRLTKCTRQEDLVGRLGGDEFIILLPCLDTKCHQAAIAARHVLENISRPFRIGSLHLNVTASIGISCYPDHGTNIDTLIHSADLAMYQTKKSGRSNYHLCTPDLERRAKEALSLESRLKNALKDEGLVLHYQPVVNIQSGQLIAAEALVRLTGDQGELIGPQHFIPLAESLGLIAELGDWVARAACRQHETWLRQGLLPVTVAINVSPLQFKQREFAERLGDIISSVGIDPAYFQLELTESTVMEHVDEVVEIFQRIKILGVKIALDDFGIGFSSLSRLSCLPLDKLKIDQSFVRNIEHDSTSLAVTKAIIALGQTLNLDIVGEGIESEGMLHRLRDCGCNQAQGFLLSRPLPPEEFAGWCRQHTG